MTQKTAKNAKELAELTFELLDDCVQKEVSLASKFGLTRAEFHCLRLLNIGEAVSNKELANRLKLSPGRITRILNGLVKKGYTHRKTVANDRRSLNVTLSKKGENMVGQLQDGYIKIHEEILRNIKPSLHVDLISGMTQLLLALRKWLNKSGDDR